MTLMKILERDVNSYVDSINVTRPVSDIRMTKNSRNSKQRLKSTNGDNAYKIRMAGEREVCTGRNQGLLRGSRGTFSSRRTATVPEQNRNARRHDKLNT